MAPAEAMRRADAAIVAKLVKVVPRGRLRADYRYRVSRVYRGTGTIARDEVISVRSANRTSACGLPRRQENPVGLFLLRDERRHWTAGICSTIAPQRLSRVAKRGYGPGPSGAHSSAAGCTS
jgi:hypothetical protein